MEWLTALKLLSEAGNAETIEQLQQQVNTQTEAIIALGRINQLMALGFGIALFVLIAGSVVETILWAQKNKKLKERLDQTSHALEITRMKLEKIVPLVEKAAGVKIV